MLIAAAQVVRKSFAFARISRSKIYTRSTRAGLLSFWRGLSYYILWCERIEQDWRSVPVVVLRRVRAGWNGLRAKRINANCLNFRVIGAFCEKGLAVRAFRVIPYPPHTYQRGNAHEK